MRARYRTTDLDTATIRKIAAEANCDPRTVVRRLTGRRVAGVCSIRIDEAIIRLGLKAAREDEAA